ncbi:MAG: serine hydrolase, partial [Patescibacteria group bacterium]
SAELLTAFKPAQKTEPAIPSTLPPVPNLIAEAALVYDPLHDTVIFEKKSAQTFGIASITKVMTALVAFDRLGPEERILISRDAVLTEGSEGDLAVGEHFSLRDLAALMLTSSSNDAAAAMVEHIGRLYGAATFEESQIIFTRLMNEYAHGLNLTGTLFQNPTGLDLKENTSSASNISTAHDLALLMKHAYSHPLLADSAAAASITVYSDEGRKHHADTTHDVLITNPGVISGKTGFTDAAGGALLTVAEAPLGQLSIIVVLGSTREGRFTDTKALLDWLRGRSEI